MKSIVILISGNGSNAQAIIKESLSGILKNILKVELVISNKIDAKGIKKAENLGIKTKIIVSKKLKRKTHEKKIIEHLKENLIKPDYIVLAGYMKILSPYFINKFKNKIINIHPADSKQYQGLHGYLWAYENRLKSTKITVHYVDKGVDTGKIIAQKEFKINTESLEDIKNKGLKIEHVFYSKVLKELIERKL